MIELTPYQSDAMTNGKNDSRKPRKPRLTSSRERQKLFERQGKNHTSRLQTLQMASFIGSIAFTIYFFTSLQDSLGQTALGRVLICGITIPMLIFLVLFAPFIVTTIYVNLWHWSLRRQLGAPHMQASTNVIHAGQELHLIYRQGIRKSMEMNNISIQLVRKEWVRYYDGSVYLEDESYSVIDAVEYPNVSIEGSIMLEKHARFQIPPHAMHTLNFDHNKLTWLIKVNLDIQNSLNFSEVYEIEILATEAIQ